MQLQPLVDALREAVLAQRVIHADETPVSMLAPGEKKTHRAYVWAYSTTPFADLKAVVYDFSPSRAGEHARNFLGQWNGKLVCDDFAGYKASFEQGTTASRSAVYGLSAETSGLGFSRYAAPFVSAATSGEPPPMPIRCLLPGLIIAFCVASPLVAVAAERSTSPQDNQASVTLLQSASQQLQAGQVDQAASTLERALRIEPNNPATLHYLGQVRFQQGQYQQAEALAARSNMQVGRNSKLRRRNDQLIQTAQQARASNNPVASTEDLMAIQKGLEEEVLSRREAGIAAVQQDSPEIEPRAISSVPSQAEWIEESQTVGSPVSGGRFETMSFEPEPMFDEWDIPRGHRPPPGKCRIWYPDRPAGHQPPPGSCHKLQYRVPAGAYLVGG